MVATVDRFAKLYIRDDKFSWSAIYGAGRLNMTDISSIPLDLLREELFTVVAP